MISGFIKSHWRSVVIAILSVFSVSIMTLLLPVLMGGVGSYQAAIWKIMVGYVLVFALASAFRVGSFANLSNRVGDYFLNQGLCAIFSNPRELPEQDYRQLKTDIDKVISVCEQSMSQFLRNIILIVGGFGMMVKTSWMLSGLILILLPMCLLPVFFLRRSYRSTLQDLTNEEAQSENTRTSYVKYVDQIWHYQHEQWALDRIKDQQGSMSELRNKKLFYRVTLSFFAIAMVMMALVVIAYMAIEGSAQHSNMETGDILQFAIAAFLVAIAMSGMSELQHQMMSMKMALGRIEALLQFQKPRSDTLGNQLKAMGLSFGYDERCILSDFSLDVIKGEKIAIVGPSGVGKSTLLKILVGHINPDKGKILYQVNECAYLMEEVPILIGSIWDNLTLGAEIQVNEVKKGITAVGLEDSIGELPLNQMMPDLSAGQKQRVDLLRAIFQNRSILVLDEPTSHLDFNLQAKINDYLCQLNQTIVVSSHQLDFIQRADRVVFLSGQGKHEVDSHEKLLKSSKAYQLFMKEIDTNEKNSY